MIVSVPINVIGTKATLSNGVGPKLTPYGIDLNKALELINKITKSYEGIEVKINVEIDTQKRTFEINLVKPLAKELIKTYSKGGEINLSSLYNIARTTNPDLKSTEDIEKKVRELIGTCKSMHIIVR